jgi:type II secretory pathway component PulJ
MDRAGGRGIGGTGVRPPVPLLQADRRHKMIRLRKHSVRIRVGRLRLTVAWGVEMLRDLWAKGIWVTGDGVRIPVEEMASSHLVNSVNMLARRAWQEAQQTQCVLIPGECRVGEVEIAEAMFAKHPATAHLLREMRDRHIEYALRLPWREQ